MSAAKHTLGPWQSKQENNYVPAQVWADGRQLCEVYGESREARKANADLIAAAPALLDTLKTVLDVTFAYHKGDEAGRPWLSAARQAIAKAEGKS